MIAIIGAGPAGCYSAFLLAKAGRKVTVFEEHELIGRPVACTGIITGINSEHFVPPEDMIVNRIQHARIIAPNGENVKVSLKSDVILDRAALDQHLASIARQAGAEFRTGWRFAGCERKGGRWVVTVLDASSGKTQVVEADILVGADGPLSRVAKATGLYGKRTFYAGMQVTADVENDGMIDFYPVGTDIAWLVPESRSRARIGVAAAAHVDKVFDRFMRRVAGPGYESRIVERQAGLIPLYNPRLKTAKDNVFLVGDAATTVKAPTLGGINQALIGARCMARAITEQRDYERLWKAAMGRDLLYSLLMRRLMNRFTDEDYNQLVRIFRKDKNRAVLERYDRDVPSRFALRLALREPRLILFASKVFHA